MLAAFGTVAVLASLLGSTVMLRNNLSEPLLIQRLGNDIVSVGSRIVSVPVSWFTYGIDSVKDLQNAADENSHLKKKVAELAQVEARNAALEKENKQLKAAAGIKKTLTGYTTTTASVISRSSDSWSEVLTIDKGKSSGLKKDMAVMSGGGVIGRILEVDAVTSKVELITTTDSSANRFAVQATTDTGKVLHGIISVQSNGALTFTQASSSSKLKKGTKVYTSGLGGTSPKGLLIGTVAETTKDSFGLSDLIKIKPAGNLSDASVVTVVKRSVAG
ncbi:cell shape-determining protein MreC [Lactobacillus delbrueckii subsp. bulgaricus]|uniref:Cell shape-determining protein MreC n=2 Tax=Lactobacillus delbrueckii TaxID=1584 RepID=Q1GAU4_LACDA|nr:cell shape-determining protein MreC [Lactobacillus delbrueckii subsp. bulgaricus]CAI97559.1 Cell shape determining protein MreC [Lactobacillus delbrueckii subsp. bulgaricus ATCC 11842 = JCM 1002]